MTLRAIDLDLPHPEASRTLLSITERHAEQQLSRLPTGDDFMLGLRQRIRTHLPEGSLTLDGLGKEVGLSPRTLQRRLTAEGTSLRHLLDEERRGLALHYIHDARISLVDIAFLLGFADQSAFSRAFSRWTSRSPSDYRRGASRPR
jgi:AraC-like DNA-binding protein